MVEVLRGYSNHTRVRSIIDEILSPPPRPPEKTRARQNQNRLNIDDQLKLIETYRRTRSVYAVAREFKVSRQTVAAILERHGVKRNYKVLTTRSVAKAKRLYDSGKSLADVGYEVGADPQTVSKALRAAGVTIRPVGTNQWSK